MVKNINYYSLKGRIWHFAIKVRGTFYYFSFKAYSEKEARKIARKRSNGKPILIAYVSGYYTRSLTKNMQHHFDSGLF